MEFYSPKNRNFVVEAPPEITMHALMIEERMRLKDFSDYYSITLSCLGQAMSKDTIDPREKVVFDETSTNDLFKILDGCKELAELASLTKNPIPRDSWWKLFATLGTTLAIVRKKRPPYLLGHKWIGVELSMQPMPELRKYFHAQSSFSENLFAIPNLTFRESSDYRPYYGYSIVLSYTSAFLEEY